MNLGNPTIKTRVTKEMLAEIEQAIDKRNMTTREEPWDMSMFIRKAIREKLDHMQRSRTSRRWRNT